MVGDITARTMSEIRGEGKERARRQVDGLTWDDVERVCAASESSDTAAGLRDAAMISLMSDCLLRISEAVAVNVQDVQDEGLQVHGKKADAEKRGDVSVYLRIDTTVDTAVSKESRNCVGSSVPEDTLPESCD